MPASLKKPPVGVGAAIVANSIVRRTPCSGVTKPVLSLISVATKPGFIALTLIRVSRNSLAKAIMIALAAALDAEYAVRGQRSEPAQRIDQSRQRTHPRADHDDDLLASPFSNVGVTLHFRNWQQLFQPSQEMPNAYPDKNQRQKLDQDILCMPQKKTPHRRCGARIIDFDQNSDGLSVTFSQISRPREIGPS